MAHKLYRLLNRGEFERPDERAFTSKSLISFRDSMVDFNMDRKAFSTKQLITGILGGLSLRKTLPVGRSSSAVHEADIPEPEAWGTDVFFIPVDHVTGLMKEITLQCDRLRLDEYYEVSKRANPYPNRNMELVYFRCYELPADSFPEGFHTIQDDFPTTGHVTLCTTSPQKGALTSVMGATRIQPSALENLPWKLVGYVLCPGAAPDPRATGDPDGEYLIATLCEHQSMLSLEQLESLRMLVTAPVYTIDALAAYLPPAAAFDLQEGARKDVSDPDEWSILYEYYFAVGRFFKSGAAPAVTVPYANVFGAPVAEEEPAMEAPAHFGTPSSLAKRKTPEETSPASDQSSPTGVELRLSEGYRKF